VGIRARVGSAKFVSDTCRYQDQILEIEQGEEEKKREQTKAAKAAEHERVVAEANLSGLDTLFDTMINADKDLTKVQALNTHNNIVNESLDDYRRDFQQAVEDFSVTVTQRHQIKMTETTDFTGNGSCLHSGPAQSADDLAG
jgi:cytoskeletal protein RodZ